MNPLKRPHDTYRNPRHDDDAYDDDYPQSKRPTLRSGDLAVAAPSPRIPPLPCAHIPPLPRTHVVRAMRNMQGALQSSGMSTTSNRPMDRQLVDAEKEILQLKAALEEVKVAIRDHKRDLCKTRGTLSDLDQSLTCEICTCRLERPVALACGHTYCSDCIKQWFQCALSAHVAVHGYSPKDVVSPQMRSAIRGLSLPSSVRQRIFVEVDILVAQCPQPKYTCPKCRHRVNRTPTPIFALQHLSATMASSQNGQPESEVRAFEVTFWDDFFSIGMRDLADI